MTAYNEYMKNAIYNYIETHKEEWKEQNRKNVATYYQRNKEKLREKAKQYYLIRKQLRNESSTLKN
jgi:hypothetical protein